MKAHQTLREKLCTTRLSMERPIKLAAALAVAMCPTATPLMSTAPCLQGSSLAGHNVGPVQSKNTHVTTQQPAALQQQQQQQQCVLTLGKERISGGRRNTLELRASVRGGDGAWGAEVISAARERLINSEDFEALFKRLEAQTILHDNAEADDEQERRTPYNASAAAAAAAAATTTTTTTTTGVPSVAAIGIISTGIGPMDPAATTTTTTTSEQEDNQARQSPSSSWMRPLWQKNATKLENLRTTIRESDKAHEIAATLRRAASSSVLVNSSSPRGWTSTVGSVQGGDSSFPGRAEVTKGGAFVQGGQGGEGKGKKSGRRLGAPAIRWIRNVASKVSNVGKRAGGRVARVVGNARD